MTKDQFLKLLPTEVRLSGVFATRRVTVNGVLLTAEKSQQVRNHSPDGFAWGYGGSGPAQLALAILLIWVPAELAQQYYQDFKFGFVAGLPQNDFNVRINLRDVMTSIVKHGPFEAVKRSQGENLSGV